MTTSTEKLVGSEAAEPAAKKQKLDAPELSTAEPGDAGATDPASNPAPVNGEAEPAVAADKSEVAGWPSHKLNINFGLMKDSEGKRFSEIADAGCEILQGIGEKSSEVCEKFGVKTVADLANYKYYKIAKAIAALAPLEEKDGRKESSVMNIDTAVDYEFEEKSFAEILDAPVSALQGLSEATAQLMDELNVKTVRDLASFKFCVWAEGIVALAEFEHKKSAAERKAEKMLKKLA